jgi:hypothetical protein
MPFNSALERNRTHAQSFLRKIFRPAIHARCLTDPLIHHGRHFGRTQHTLCSIRTLLRNGVFRRTEFDDDGILNVPARYLPCYIMPICMPFALTFLSFSRERREHRIFQTLLQMVPGLENRIMSCSEEEVRLVADLVCIPNVSYRIHSQDRHKIQRGVSSARSDDTKSLKGVVIDWITPRGQFMDPPLARNIKTDRGFNHDFTGRLLCPAGLDWADQE